MSFTSAAPGEGDARAERRERVTDPRALRALAHPLRLALLNHLMTFGARTASECAEVVGSTASNCSYHLRALARFGLVEPLDSVDGRERPWRSVATGLDFGPHESDPADLATRAVQDVLAESRIDEDAELARRTVAGLDALPAAWRDASSMATYALRMSPSELAALAEGLDALIRPYIALTRADAPADASVVHLHLDAFLHPDAEL